MKKWNYSENYFIASVENHKCSKCTSYTKINNTFIVCGCDIDGAVRSYKDGNCYLPDSNEIKEILIDKTNTQYYLEDGVTHNYYSKTIKLNLDLPAFLVLYSPNAFVNPDIQENIVN